MSFSLTTHQIENKTKTVTRRLGWDKLNKGDLIIAVEKCMGLNKGERHVKICTIKILSNRKEPLSLDYINSKECSLEGFPEKTPQEFIKMFTTHNDCKIGQEVNRIEFDYI
ncbi:MAG: ASCH domain-containing protein [Desulfobacterales bacterium]|nr:ASCH domain-containing protein [Desulfobacterales bacterium]